MYLLGLGLVLGVMKYLEMGPVASWDWWVIAVPFGLAVLWWTWSDSSGYTKKKAMEREDVRRQARIDRNHEALGTISRKKRR